MKPPAGSSSSGEFLASNFSPAGLHVLVVDDDPLCVMVLERMLKQCSYKVTTCTRVDRALQLLREDQDNFDIVMTDVYMPNEDGFKLLEVIGLELDLPVIMMSGNSETSVVLKGITHGACDYLIKPVRIEELKNIWQHVLRKKGKVYHHRAADLKGEVYDSERTGESQDQLPKKRKEQATVDLFDCSVDVDDASSLKKARVNWSVQLHRRFVNAVNELGVDKAVPKRILDIMNVQGLTRENVASHLQKYRLYLKRLSGVVPEPYPIASFQALGDGSMGGTMLVQPAGKSETVAAPVNVKGLNLGAGVGSGAARVRKIDSGTIESLTQFKAHHQQQAANRAQVLGALGVADQRRPSSNGLHRMMSLDLSCFLQAQQQDSPPTASYSAGRRGGVQPYNDLGGDNMRSVKHEEGAAELQRGEGPVTLEWNIEEDEKINHFILASSGGASNSNNRRMLAVAEVEVEDEDDGDEEINEGDDNDAVSSSANVMQEQVLPGSSANEQLSGSSMSPDACSFVALDDLGPPLLPAYMDNTELDITDYLQLDKGGFTYQH